jgi:hypothetical protein
LKNRQEKFVFKSWLLRRTLEIFWRSFASCHVSRESGERKTKLVNFFLLCFLQPPSFFIPFAYVDVVRVFLLGQLKITRCLKEKITLLLGFDEWGEGWKRKDSSWSIPGSLRTNACFKLFRAFSSSHPALVMFAYNHRLQIWTFVKIHQGWSKEMR